MQMFVAVALSFLFLTFLLTALFLNIFTINYKETTKIFMMEDSKEFHLKLADWATSSVIGKNALRARMCYAALVILLTFSLIFSATTLVIFFATLDKPHTVVRKAIKAMLVIMIISIILCIITAYFIYATYSLKNDIELSF